MVRTTDCSSPALSIFSTQFRDGAAHGFSHRKVLRPHQSWCSRGFRAEKGPARCAPPIISAGPRRWKAFRRYQSAADVCGYLVRRLTHCDVRHRSSAPAAFGIKQLFCESVCNPRRSARPSETGDDSACFRHARMRRPCSMVWVVFASRRAPKRCKGQYRRLGIRRFGHRYGR